MKHEQELQWNERFLGTRLKVDKFNKSGVVIIAENTELNRIHLRKLQLHHIELTDEDVEWVGAFVTNQVYPHRGRVEESVRQVTRIFDDMRYLKRIPLMDVRNHVLPVIEHAAEEINLFSMLSTLQTRDDYTYRHNVAVGIVATMIGRWLGLEETELAQLSVAAALHDVGKTKIPAELLTKPGRLTDEEYKQVKEHTTYGYEMIRETVGMNQRQALVALQHHERMDGSGYPLGLKGDQIDSMSRIVAVADIFHAMTSKRVYQEASPFYETMKELQEYAFGKLDPHIVHVFLSHMMQSIIGHEVLLSDGRTARIVMVNPRDALRPVVYFGGDDHLDLTKAPDLTIERVIV